MKGKRFFLFLFIFTILPFISADGIMPGWHGVSINNYITNINEFPNYIFVQGMTMNSYGGPGIGMCGFSKMGGGGIVPGAYKFCDISVYAIEKSKWNEVGAQKFMQNVKENVTGDMFFEFLNSMGAKEVIKNIESYKQVPDSNGLKEESRYYSIDLQKVKEEPDRTDKNQNYTPLIAQILLPFVALIIIVIILVRRKG